MSGNAFNIGAEGAQFFFHAVVASVKVVNAFNAGFAVGDERGNHQTGRRAQIGGHDGGAGKLRHAVNHGGACVHADACAHAREFADVHEAVFKNGFCHGARARCHAVERHELRLHVGGKTGIFTGAETLRAQRHAAQTGDGDGVAFDEQVGAGGAQLFQYRFQMLRARVPHLHLPLSFDYAEIETHYRTFCDAAGIPYPDFVALTERCEDALDAAKQAIGDAPVEIDYTVTSRPLSLARMLLSHGFRVTRVYLDGISGEERVDLDALQKTAPDLLLSPTVDPVMRVRPRETEETTLAVGQKAAWFTGTDRFVNLVGNGGLYGFCAVYGMAEMMADAWRKPKDARRLIQIKGMGCSSCL